MRKTRTLPPKRRPRSARHAEPPRAPCVRIIVADTMAIDRGGLVGLLDDERDLEVVGEAATVQETMRQALANGLLDRRRFAHDFEITLVIEESHQSAAIDRHRVGHDDPYARRAGGLGVSRGAGPPFGRQGSCLSHGLSRLSRERSAASLLIPMP